MLISLFLLFSCVFFFAPSLLMTRHYYSSNYSKFKISLAATPFGIFGGKENASNRFRKWLYDNCINSSEDPFHWVIFGFACFEVLVYVRVLNEGSDKMYVNLTNFERMNDKCDFVVWFCMFMCCICVYVFDKTQCVLSNVYTLIHI